MLYAVHSVSDSESRLGLSWLAHIAHRAHSRLTRAVAAEDGGKETAPLTPSADNDSDSDSDVGTPLALTRGRESSAASHRLVSKLDGRAWQSQQYTPPASTRASGKRKRAARHDPETAQTKFFKAGPAPPPRLLAAAERAKSSTN